MRALLLALLLATPALADDVVSFESGQVRPLALSPDGTRLFAVNTPDARLEILDVTADGLRSAGSVPVGLEPVAVAARTDGEVWVVNHLSDSVSVVDVAATPPRVVRTLPVGDEPRDVVFAGPGRAFVTAARRGQHRPEDPALSIPGVGRADVWVFDASDPGGAPPTVVTLFGDTPRALAVSPDGTSVYVAVFQSGNRTTTIPEGAVCDGGPAAPPCDVAGLAMPGGLPGPRTNVEGIAAPETGLIVQQDVASGHWLDELGRAWDPAVRFTLPDLDVFRLDATTLATTGTWAHVGTILYGMAVHPTAGTVYVANTEARNADRFEGPGVFAGHTVRGHLHESHVTLLDGDDVVPRHLNPHIDYGVVPSPPGTAEKSLALPVAVAAGADGGTLYVAALGSGVVARIDTAALAAGTFAPAAADHATLTGGGPTGLVVDAARNRLYVLTRFDDGVSVVDLGTWRETSHVRLHDPEPADVVAGRPLLYDARVTSSNGEAACASCHVFGDTDGLAWDLGNPDGVVVPNPNPIHSGDPAPFHPMKGPMTTQTLRGMASHGPMHWRGDRTGGSLEDGDPLSADQAFREFVVAFEGLLGRDGAIHPDAMGRFGAFALRLAPPPNPNRALDGTLTPEQQAGRDLFLGRTTDASGSNCVGCHDLAPRAGHFGTSGQSAVQGQPQLFKVPQLRTLYQKVGMFGATPVPFLSGGTPDVPAPQVRGTGFLHDGSVDTIDRFLAASPFFLSDVERRQLEAWILAFDTDLAPVVGQQATVPGADADARLALLASRADAGDCDLVVHAVRDGALRGGLRVACDRVVLDRQGDAPLARDALRTAASLPDAPQTWTCLPPGTGVRAALDRDGDGFLDGDERDAGTDPADAAGTPAGTPLPLRRVGIPATALALRAARGGATATLAFTSRTRRADGTARIAPPPSGTMLDPTRYGAVLQVYGAAFTDDLATQDLPAAGWRRLGGARRPKGFRFRARDAGGGPIRSVVLGPDRLVVRGTLPYRLDEPAQGTVAVRLVPGLLPTSGWCAAAGARRRGAQGSTARDDRPGRFVGAPRSPAPATCPPLP